MRAVALLLVVFLITTFHVSKVDDLSGSVTANVATRVTKIDDRLLLLNTSSFLLWAADYQNRSFTGAFLYPHLLNKSDTAVLLTGSWHIPGSIGQIWRWDNTVWWTSNYQWHLFKEGDFPYDRYSWYAIIGFTEPIGQRLIHSEFATEIMSLWSVNPLTLSNMTTSTEDQLTKVGFNLKPYRDLRKEMRIDHWYLLQIVFSRTNEQITSATAEQNSQATKEFQQFVIEITGVLVLIVAVLTFYLQFVRKPRWRKYQYRELPYETIFRGKEYGYDPGTFLSDPKSVELALTKLRTWHDDNGKPLLVRGATGVGKSRLVTEFIGSLSFKDRLKSRVLMPTPHDVNEKLPPIFAKGCILFLNDLHEFRDSVPDWKLRFYIEDKKFKVIATIPTEKYDSSWAILSGFIWDEISLKPWTAEDGRRLAKSKKITFEPGTFKGTPLSVLAPDAELKRAFELLPQGAQTILQILKIIKTYLGCFADYELISAIHLPGRSFDRSDFLIVISKRGFWCRTYDSKCILADGVENVIPYQVSIQDAYALQTLLGVE